MEKPISGDDEQRRAQTRAAREQSGLPPEHEAEDAPTPQVGRQEQPLQKGQPQQTPERDRTRRKT